MAQPARDLSRAPLPAPPEAELEAADLVAFTRLPAVIPDRLMTRQLPALPMRSSLLARILHGLASLAGVVLFVVCMIGVAVALGGQP